MTEPNSSTSFRERLNSWFDFSTFDRDDFIAGWVGGAAGIVVGQPFDTIKVWQQIKGAEENSFRTLARMIREKGPLSPFGGVISPSVGYGFCTAISTFFCWSTVKRYGRALGMTGSLADIREEIPLRYVWLGGFYGGIAQAFLLSPAELIKIQIQKPAAQEPTIRDVCRDIWSTKGARGFGRGLFTTIVRDGPAFAGYYGVYEFLKRRWNKNWLQEKEEGVEEGWISTKSLIELHAGGLGGIFSWAINFPIDLVKTRMQEDLTLHRNSWRCFQHVIRTRGIRGLYAGFGPCVFRAYPVNAVTFFLMERVLGWLGS